MSGTSCARPTRLNPTYGLRELRWLRIVVARMQVEGRNPGCAGGTRIALRKLRSIRATLAELRHMHLAVEQSAAGNTL